MWGRLLRGLNITRSPVDVSVPVSDCEAVGEDEVAEQFFVEA